MAKFAPSKKETIAVGADLIATGSLIEESGSEVSKNGWNTLLVVRLIEAVPDRLTPLELAEIAGALYSHKNVSRLFMALM